MSDAATEDRDRPEASPPSHPPDTQRSAPDGDLRLVPQPVAGQPTPCTGGPAQLCERFDESGLGRGVAKAPEQGISAEKQDATCSVQQRAACTTATASLTSSREAGIRASASPVAALPDELLSLCLGMLAGKELAACRLTSKRFCRLGSDPALWERLLRSECFDFGRELSLARGESADCAVLSYRRARSMCELQRTRWLRVHPDLQRVRPDMHRNRVTLRAQEGHAAALLDDRWLVAVCGFGNGIRNDAWVFDTWSLDRRCGGSGERLRWHPLTLSDNVKPRPKYGHTLAAISANRIACLGGVRFGGYRGDVSDLHFFRVDQRQPDADADAGDDGRGGAESGVGAVEQDGHQEQTAGEADYHGNPVSDVNEDGGDGNAEGADDIATNHVGSNDDTAVADSNQATLLTATWEQPRLEEPCVSRAYASLTCISTDTGRHLITYGGISHGTACDSLQELTLDVVVESTAASSSTEYGESQTMLQWRTPVVTGHGPGGLFGHSAHWLASRQRLVIVGGSDGSDLLRDGEDFCCKYVHLLRLEDSSGAAWAWERILVSGDVRLAKRIGGRCHYSCLVGERILCFAGGANVSAATGAVHLSDASTARCEPLATEDGPTPRGRTSGIGVRAGRWFIIHGGWSYAGHAVGDMHVLQLDAAVCDGFEPPEVVAEEDSQPEDDELEANGAQISVIGFHPAFGPIVRLPNGSLVPFALLQQAEHDGEEGEEEVEEEGESGAEDAEGGDDDDSDDNVRA